MKSFVTSFSGLFARNDDDTPRVERIEIPLIQRDYAQGRTGSTVQRVRDAFLDVLHAALTAPGEVSLDFVYGEVDEGTLRPLDGQQRLTTLFLLHWYLAARTDRLGQEQAWQRFTYATRPSARSFCQSLVASRPPTELERISAWIEDQPWFLFTWEHDPTIRSMLVVLDAIHERFRSADCVTAWERLVDARTPAICFHLLPIEQLGLSEDIYIKMNSRGKPLTPFENFKARFEQILETSCPDKVGELAKKVDTAWSDLLWRYRGSDNLIDDEFLRYFRFVTEICDWRDGGLGSGDDGQLAERIYGKANPRAAQHLAFLFEAFNTWVNEDIAAAFGGLFSPPPASSTGDPSRVALFGLHEIGEVDLFATCCRSYGERRIFSLGQTLLLYAVVLHHLGGIPGSPRRTPEFARRLRVLRNLIEASGSELRLERMPLLVADVQRLVEEGDLEQITAFNQAQVADERLKAELLARHPELQPSLFQLEDHPILRGCLFSFELDADCFERRAAAFQRLFADPADRLLVTGALLATGDYSQRHANGRFFQFGTAKKEDGPWRKLLAGTGRSEVQKTRTVLGKLLDEVTTAGDDLRKCLAARQQRWIEDCDQNQTLDWRYYLVKYPAMRESWSGIYTGERGRLSYSICMLNKQQMNSNYRDPYLLAVRQSSSAGDEVQDPVFTGHESLPRWMKLVRSGTALRCVELGFELQPPGAPSHAEAFARVCKERGIAEGNLLLVPQVERDKRLVDSQDRIQLCATLLREFVAAGL